VNPFQGVDAVGLWKTELGEDGRFQGDNRTVVGQSLLDSGAGANRIHRRITDRTGNFIYALFDR